MSTIESQSDPRITVSLTSELLAFIERAAERESRSVSGQVRHLIVQAARAAGSPTAAPWPPIRVPNVGHTLEEIAQAKNLLAEWEGEQERLRAMPEMDKTVTHETRWRELRDDVATLPSNIAVAERMARP
jgi:hypothetical protein